MCFFVFRSDQKDANDQREQARQREGQVLQAVFQLEQRVEQSAREQWKKATAAEASNAGEQRFSGPTIRQHPPPRNIRSPETLKGCLALKISLDITLAIYVVMPFTVADEQIHLARVTPKET